jgi:thiol-disulfide isomerase/thioredoxin
VSRVILFEDQAVRTSICLGLLSICLGLAGCTSFGKKQTAQGGGNRPFLGSGPASSGGSGGSSSGGGSATAAATDPATPLPGANGLLAGQVLDRMNHRPSKVFIQVVDLQEAKSQPSARLEVESQQDGYFVVQGLQPGKHYRLIARAKDGDKVLSGTTVAMPPNPRLSIVLSEDFSSPDTPPVPGAPSLPGRSSGGTNSDGAALEPPVKTRPGESPSKQNEGGTPSSNPGTPAAPGPGVMIPINPAQIAKDADNVRDGFRRVPPPPTVDMPGPAPAAPYPLPPTPLQPAPGGPQGNPLLSAPAVQPQGEGPGIRLPTVPTPVPSCVVAGNKVENFALYDVNGQPWEFRRHRIGKLVLLDFWFSTCPACLQSMPHLVDMQRRYAQYGLEVVGIADERGTPEEQVMKVRRVRARYGISYTTLLSGGPHCPVKWQLRVQQFPTVILLNDKGDILWHSEKNVLDEDTLRDLETEIRRQLAIR